MGLKWLMNWFLERILFYLCRNRKICFLRNCHLFDYIYTNRKTQKFQNERFNFTFHRAGLFPWNWPANWPKLPVSTTIWQFSGHCRYSHPSFCYRWDLCVINYGSWLCLTFLISDYDLNTVCHDICYDETFKCIMSCDTNDSECVYTCIRAEAVCIESKLFQFW